MSDDHYDLPPARRTFSEARVLELMQHPEAAGILGLFYEEGRITLRITHETADVLHQMLRGFHVARPRREKAREDWVAALERDREDLMVAMEQLDLLVDWRKAQLTRIRQELTDAEMALALMDGRPMTVQDGGAKSVTLRRPDLQYAMQAVGDRYGVEEAERLFRLAMANIKEGDDAERIAAIRTAVATEHPETADMLAYNPPPEAD